MRYAHIVLDIPTRALERAFDYAIPDELENEVLVGTTVLGALLFKEALTLPQVVCVILIAGGIAGLKLLE